MSFLHKSHRNSATKWTLYVYGHPIVFHLFMLGTGTRRVAAPIDRVCFAKGRCLRFLVNLLKVKQPSSTTAQTSWYGVYYCCESLYICSHLSWRTPSSRNGETTHHLILCSSLNKLMMSRTRDEMNPFTSTLNPVKFSIFALPNQLPLGADVFLRGRWDSLSISKDGAGDFCPLSNPGLF